MKRFIPALILVAGLVACGTHLSSLDRAREQNQVELFASLQKDVPDSGAAKLKAQAGYCNGRAILRSAGVDVPDGGAAFPCPNQ